MARGRAPLLEVSSQHPEPQRVRQAVQRLKAEEVIVYPTDTIYGLAVDFESRAGMEKLYALRKLDPKKPLSLVCSSMSEASQYAVIHNNCYRFMRRALPGPYTFVLNASPNVPRTGDKKRRAVGIRVPESKVAQAIIEALGHPVWNTSAIFDDEEPDGVSDPKLLAERYGEGVGLVLDAGILDGTPSTVIDWTNDEPVILRRGAGDVSELE